MRPSCFWCGRPVPTGFSYAIFARPERYCGREHMDLAFEAFGGGGGKKKMRIPAAEFGKSGVHVLKCDAEGCGRPINLNWKGKSGRDYCSNACRKATEKENMTDQNEATATATETSPITSGTSEPKPTKKSAKKTAKTAKKAPVKAAPKPKATSAKAPAKTAPAKTPKTPKAASNGAGACPFGIFRDGSGKAAVSTVLGDKLWHPVADLIKACEKTGVTKNQVKVALGEIPARDKGLVVEYRKDDTEVRVSKAK